MAIHTIPGMSVQYFLMTFDAKGLERSDDPDGPGGRLSARVLQQVVSESITDVFLYSHGWKGDIPSAVDQYSRWLRAIHSLSADQAAMAARWPGFKPMHAGLHWPSLPWGDEDLSGGAVAFAAAAAAPQALVDDIVARLDDTPRVRAAVEIIVDESRRNAAASTMTARARAAYLDLNDALTLGSEGVGGDPGSDREAFDPDRAMSEGEQVPPEFGGLSLGGLLGPVRQLSFWTMKKRGRTVGEGGMHTFLLDLQRAAPDARIHLMGHSFGCIVVSSMLGGPGGTSPLLRPVDSCVLVQGAMSMWSYSPDIPVQSGTPGYWHRVLADGKVRGPIVTTQSRHDSAVGLLYPLAAGAARQVAFGPFPKYGAAGFFGLQGLGGVVGGKMLDATGRYDFRPGGVYNLDGSDFITHGGGLSGAHNDIDGPEVAHVIWAAAVRS